MANFSANRPRVAVLCGGDSPEREISLLSGRSVHLALENRGHAAVMIDPADVALERVDWSDFDVAFIALHGGAGEDGRVQGQLEQLGVPYTGSGPMASRLAMSKSASKERFVQAGVPSAPYLLWHREEPLDDVRRRLERIGYPLVVKPDGQGSSLGVQVVLDALTLADAVAEAAHFDSYLIAEPFLTGRELTVAVLDRLPAPPLSIEPPSGMFDFHTKYESAVDSVRDCPDLTIVAQARIQQIAVDAAAALDTRGLVRVDIRTDAAGVPMVLEVNTSPGMTARSLAPRAMALAGQPFDELCGSLVQLATAEEMLV